MSPDKVYPPLFQADFPPPDNETRLRVFSRFLIFPFPRIKRGKMKGGIKAPEDHTF
jgi:hypothetical protein